MSERHPASQGDRSYELLITRSEAAPSQTVVSIDDDLVVAAVDGSRVRLFDGDGLAEEYDCDSPEAAEREALGYAMFLQRPPQPPEETP
jgi:hypothetical protein